MNQDADCIVDADAIKHESDGSVDSVDGNEARQRIIINLRWNQVSKIDLLLTVYWGRRFFNRCSAGRYHQHCWTRLAETAAVDRGSRSISRPTFTPARPVTIRRRPKLYPTMKRRKPHIPDLSIIRGWGVLPERTKHWWAILLTDAMAVERWMWFCSRKFQLIPDHVVPHIFFYPYIPGTTQSSGKQNSLITM